MKLYFTKGTSSLSVRIIINELNLSCKYIAVNLTNSQTEDNILFSSLNPMNSVPTLVLDDGQVLTQNTNIHQYLAEKENAFHLLPPVGNIKRYQVLQWMSFICSDLHKGALSPLYNPKIPLELKEEIFKPALCKLLDLVNNKLNDSKYLANDNFTLADAYFFVALTRLPRSGIELNNYNNLYNYFNIIKEREAVKKSLSEEET